MKIYVEEMREISECVEEINEIIKERAFKRSLMDGSTVKKPIEYYLRESDFDFIKAIKTYNLIS